MMISNDGTMLFSTVIVSPTMAMLPRTITALRPTAPTGRSVPGSQRKEM
ncbi:MAG: hypothetical protein R3B82_23450 [Sandaracinaceae bacterium]